MTDQLHAEAPTTTATPSYGPPSGPVPAAGPTAYGPGQYGQAGYGPTGYGPGHGPAGYGPAGYGPPSPGPFPAPAGMGAGPTGPAGPAAHGRGAGAWFAGGAILLVVLLIAGLGVLVLAGGGDASTTPAPAPAAPSAPASPPGGSASSPPSGGGSSGGSSSGAGSGSSSGSRTLSTAFPTSAGPGCIAYTDTAGQYVTSRGGRAEEIRACPAAGGGAVVFTSWPSTADAGAVVTDQQSFRSADGRATWSMGGRPQGAWHERTSNDGSCFAALNYQGTPYAVLITAPTCSQVDAIFQDVTLPDVSTLTR